MDRLRTHYGTLLAMLACVGALSLARAAPADEFRLSGGGRISGTLLNPQQAPRRQYVVRTTASVVVTLPAASVTEVVRHSAAQVEYERLAPTFPDTSDGQWQLAEWCREQKLKSERQTALRRVVELDPVHSRARRALGYSWIRGEWVTRAQGQAEQGYQLYQGRWRLPQEVALLEEQKRDRANLAEWRAKFKIWRNNGAAREFAAVRDASAVGALAELLRREPSRDWKLLYIDVLGRIASPEAVSTIVNASLNDPDVEVFYTCADLVVQLKPAAVRESYVDALKNENNVRINRAAYILGQWGDASVISPLIDALVSHHKVVLGPPRSGGAEAMSTSFRGDGAVGFQAGTASQVFVQTAQNAQVCAALVRLADGISFGYDQAAWRRWHAAEIARGGSVRLK